MEYIDSQIKLHEGLIKLYTNHLENLKLIKSMQSTEIKQMKELVPEDFLETDFIGSDQDMIWERIRNSRNAAETAKPSGESTTKTNGESDTKNNGESIHTREDNLIAELPGEPVKEKNIVVSRLSKYTREKQNQIMQNMFKTARSNIEKIALIDSNIANNLESNIYKEADRLLEEYLNNSQSNEYL